MHYSLPSLILLLITVPLTISSVPSDSQSKAHANPLQTFVSISEMPIAYDRPIITPPVWTYLANRLREIRQATPFFQERGLSEARLLDCRDGFKQIDQFFNSYHSSVKLTSLQSLLLQAVDKYITLLALASEMEPLLGGRFQSKAQSPYDALPGKAAQWAWSDRYLKLGAHRHREMWLKATSLDPFGSYNYERWLRALLHTQSHPELTSLGAAAHAMVHICFRDMKVDAIPWARERMYMY